MGYKWANFIMKKITLVAMALLCTVVFTDCAAKKPIKKAEAEPAPVQQVDPQQAKLDSLKRAQEIRRIELQMQAEEAQYTAEMEISKLKAENARKATDKRLEQKLYTPCIEQSYDKHGEYMAGLGIADNQLDRQLGSGTANLAAISDIKMSTHAPEPKLKRASWKVKPLLLAKSRLRNMQKLFVGNMVRPMMAHSQYMWLYMYPPQNC